MTWFIANVFPYRNRVSLNGAFEVLEPDDGKPSCPVLRGPGDRKVAWLLDIWLDNFRLACHSSSWC